MQDNNAKVELNGVGKIRLSEIISDLTQQVRDEFEVENVTKFENLIFDASLAVLKIEQDVAVVKTNLIEALKSMCRVQNDIEVELTVNPKGIEKYFELAKTNPGLAKVLRQFSPKGNG